MDILFAFGKIGAYAAAAGTAYLFITTRFSLIIQDLWGEQNPTSHIYWIYKNKFLIRLTDRQSLVSAILLWNYHRLTKDVINRIDFSRDKKDVLQISCAFGNISEKIAGACSENKAKLVITDIISNELAHTERKLQKRGLAENTSFRQCDATALPYPDESFDCVVSFFLFHELPLEKKRQVLKESMRIIKPGGKLVCAEFHLPESRILRASGWLFFFVLERYAREMWRAFDIEKEIHKYAALPDEWEFSKKTFFYGNYFTCEARKIR